MDDTLTIILKDSYSLTQLKHRLRILKSYLLKDFFGKSQDQINILSLTPEDQNWLKNLPANLLKQFNKDNVYKIFTDWESKISTIPLLTLYLTFEPDEPTLEQIGGFTRKQFGPNLLLDIKLDVNLIAGAALGWKGVLKDYSLKTQIEAKKEEITAGFKRFLRTQSKGEAHDL